MAKYQTTIRGTIDKFAPFLKETISGSSSSCSIEEEAFLDYGDVKISVLCFERYSMMGGNRVSMTVNTSESFGHLVVIGMTSGGSQATFFKINTVGENQFLNKLVKAIELWNANN